MPFSMASYKLALSLFARVRLATESRRGSARLALQGIFDQAWLRSPEGVAFAQLVVIEYLSTAPNGASEIFEQALLPFSSPHN